MTALYDKIGSGYAVMRRTDATIARAVHAALRGATRIINIGAGAGSYEPGDIDLVAVEPSAEMITQRPAEAHPAQQAAAESLPFADNSFSHAMTINSMHHWSDRAQAFAEISRVATDKFVAVTWDRSAEPFWLTRDYFPEIYARDRAQFPDLDQLGNYFDDVQISVLPIPAQCEDGLFAAFWRRPQAYLQSQVRQSMSAFATMEDADPGLQRLTGDLQSGQWHEKNKALLDLPEMDCGYRLITCRIRNA